MSGPSDIIYVRLKSGVGILMEVVALVPPDSDVFDERFSTARAARYTEILEAGNLLAAGAAEDWDNQQRVEGAQ